jgi:hypothetical protein
MRLTPFLLPLLLAALLPSCSTFTYQADFEKAVAAAPDPPADPTGPWKGSWISKHNGHSGPLWCMITPTPEAEDSYDFRYHAGWGKFEFGDFTHTVPGAMAEDGSLAVKGDMKLPGFVGTYTVDGKVTKDTFKANYKSDQGDHGTMTLERP